jgi:hypothetical protein
MDIIKEGGPFKAINVFSALAAETTISHRGEKKLETKER